MTQIGNLVRPKVSTAALMVVFGIALCLSLILAPNASAQVIYGSLTGNVQDKAGAMIPNATVVVTNQATQETRTTTTNSSGEYHVVDLAPGSYTVSIKASSSFAAFLEKNVPIERHPGVPR